MVASDRPTEARRANAPADVVPAPAASAAPIVLAHEPPLRLGQVAIEPALRRLSHPDGREEFVQPRVMQVLVALARAEGAILSRDDLLMRCWGGVVVGEDAINRVMTHLRRASDSVADGDFRVETITKVGYRLVTGTAAPIPPPEPRSFAAAEPLLAVLAFDNLSGDPDFLYFSDGVSEEVLHTVAKTTSLKVVGRSSSFQLRGPDKAARRVAEALNATHILDGSVRRSGDRVRITAQLVECETQTQLWSDRFDRPLADVFALQDEIASAIAAALNTAFAPSRLIGPINPEAYDLYLQARTPNQDLGAFNIDLLERAISLQPDFAQAWALLAFSSAIHLRWSGRDSAKAADWDRMREAANRALALDPSAGIAYLALSTGLPVCGAMARQRVLVDQALAVSPNDPIVLIHACGLEDTPGRQRAAADLAARAYELDPCYAAGFYPPMLDASGRRDEANALYDRAMERWPEALLPAAGALRSAYERGDWTRYDRLKAALPPQIATHWLIGFMHHIAQRFRDWTPETSAAVMAQLYAELNQTGSVGMTWVGLACAQGLTDEIHGILEQASFTHLFTQNGRFSGADLSFNVLWTPVYAAMRQDPRFVRFCAKLGFCDYWVQTGCWPDCADDLAPFYDFRAEARRLVETAAR